MHRAHPSPQTQLPPAYLAVGRARPACTGTNARSAARLAGKGIAGAGLRIASLLSLPLSPGIELRGPGHSDLPLSTVRPPGYRSPHRLSASPQSSCLAPCCSLRCMMRPWVCPLPPRLLPPAKRWFLSFPHPRISSCPPAPCVVVGLLPLVSLQFPFQPSPHPPPARCRYRIVLTSQSGMGDSKASCSWHRRRLSQLRKDRSTSVALAVRSMRAPNRQCIRSRKCISKKADDRQT